VDGLADLGDFGLDEQGVRVTFGVVLDQDGCGFFVAVLGDEVARGFREQEDRGNLQQGRADLQKGGQTPGPVATKAGCGNGDGGGCDLADTVGGVEERSEERALLGVAELTDQGGSGNDAEENTNSEDQASNNVLRRAELVISFNGCVRNRGSLTMPTCWENA
jgi:hypothetical protein